MEPSESILQVLAHSRLEAERGGGAAHRGVRRCGVLERAIRGSQDPIREQTEPVRAADTLRLATEAGMAHLPRLMGSRDEAHGLDC